MPFILTLTELWNEFGNATPERNQGDNPSLIAILQDPSIDDALACRIAADKAEELVGDLDATLAECAAVDEMIAEAEATRGDGGVQFVSLAGLRAELDQMVEDLRAFPTDDTRDRIGATVESLAAGLSMTTEVCPEFDQLIREVRGTEFPDEVRPVKKETVSA